MRRNIFVISFATVVALILTVFNIKYPLIGLDVEKDNNGDIVITDIYEFGWAKKHGIEISDQVLNVNGEHPLSYFTVWKYNTIEQAKSITIKHKNQIKTLKVDFASQGIEQWLYYIFLPIGFFLFAVSLSIFLLRLKPNDKSAKVLIHFLLLIGICYISASLSAKYILFGRIIFNGVFLILPAVFLHFTYHYFEKEKKTWFSKKIVFFLYFVFCNRKVQRNAIKNAEVCHPFNSFSTMRGTVYSSRHEKR